ncbi:MAG: tRNA (guanosine(46)-N7)-methyltransferase TrmB [Oligoflexia bacterium]|nr:tRNA (guanosine(46)-N7)-methyltransferase TrmB [Oligoflexia bacterium]
MSLHKLFTFLKYTFLKKELPSYFYKKNKYNPEEHPNIYVGMLKDFKNQIFVEEQALKLKGKWGEVFENKSLPIDLEIGCGNGTFFEYLAKTNPDRNFLGIEYKYKPLVQTIRRLKKAGLTNGCGIRFNAKDIDDIFAPSEINNIYIYFPDPWPKRKHEKNRLVRASFLNMLFKIQSQKGFIDFKTDSESYFDFVCAQVKNTSYKVQRHTRNLHQSEWARDNFITQFENIFIRQNLPTYYMRLVK